MARATSNFGFQTLAGTAWALMRDHWLSLMVATFMRDLLSILAAGLVFALFIDWKDWSLLLGLIAACLTWCALQCGYLRLCLNLAEHNKVRWGDLFSGFSSCLEMLCATVCLCCAVGLGLVLLVVPGLVLAARFSLYGVALIDQKLSAEKSLLTSHRMVKGFAWYAAALLIIYYLGDMISGWCSYGLESLLVISLCTLYKHIRSQEIGR
jgi:hypothetical protein